MNDHHMYGTCSVCDERIIVRSYINNLYYCVPCGEPLFRGYTDMCRDSHLEVKHVSPLEDVSNAVEELEEKFGEVALDSLPPLPPVLVHTKGRRTRRKSSSDWDSIHISELPGAIDSQD